MDKNKIMLWGGALLVICLMLGFVYLIFQNNQFKKMESNLQITTTPTPSPIPLETYQNPSGFEFQYPQSVRVDENENPASYADILILSNDLSGQMSVKVTDTKVKSADEWLKKESILPKITEKKQIILADIEAVQVATPGGILAVAVDQGALFVVHLDWMENGDYWKEIYETFLSSFAFVAPTKTNPQQKQPAASEAGGGGSSDIIFEGEEIIE